MSVTGRKKTLIGWVRKPIAILIIAFLLAYIVTRAAAERDAAVETVPVHRITAKGVQEQVGKIDLRQADAALELIIELGSFPPGWHAMHVHEDPSCDPELVDGRMVAGAAAGAHFDPTGVMSMAMGPTSSTSMPDGSAEAAGPRDGKAGMEGLAWAGATDAAKKPERPPGHRPRPVGDLPAVHVNEDGSTIYRILTYRMRIEQLRGRSIMLHQYGEAPVDPALPRGGGERIACGIIE